MALILLMNSVVLAADRKWARPSRSIIEAWVLLLGGLMLALYSSARVEPSPLQHRSGT